MKTQTNRLLAALVLALLCGAGLNSCSIFGALTAEFDPDVPLRFRDSEIKYLYIDAVKKIADDVARAVPFSKNNKVWITDLVGGANTDQSRVALTVDALTHALLAAGKCSPLEKDQDMVRDMYVEYTESGYLPPKSDALAKQGKMLNADYILAFRVMKLEVQDFNWMQKAAQNYGAICSLGVLDSNKYGVMVLGMHLRAIDVQTGEVVWSGYFEKAISNRLWKNRID